MRRIVRLRRYGFSYPPEEMAFIIQDKVTYEQYAEWREANLANERKINLQSWLKGARHSMMKVKKGGEQ